MATQHTGKYIDRRQELPEVLETALATCIQLPYLRDPDQGLLTLRSIAAMLPDSAQAARWLIWLAKQVQSACDPDRTLNNWERFFRAHANPHDALLLIETSSRLSTALTTLFGSSQYLTDMILQEPAIVEWLDTDGRLFTSRPKEAMMADLADWLERSASLEDRFRILRRFRKREMVRIGLRDLMRVADLVETTEDLSNLADVCLQGAYDVCFAELTSRYGTPMGPIDTGQSVPCEFAILGLGKLGGQELNFSSDIDLIFLYSHDGETVPHGTSGATTTQAITSHEFFTRLARLLLKAIHDITSDGNVYRVDLRLRPDGRGGPIVNSLRVLEVYYESWGKTWERQMLLKARPVAGSERLGREFLQLMRPFIFRKYLDAGALQEIKQIKEQIDQSLAQQRSRGINIKLGWGGIREIEFVAQSFQLVFGGQDTWLQERHTLRALHRISERGYLTYEEYSHLAKAYIFFRELEHRLQMAHGRQTHELPADVEELATLARKMGLRGDNPEVLASVLMQRYREHTARVRKVYDKLFYGDFLDADEDASPEWYTIAGGMKAAQPLLRRLQFADPEKTYRNLMQLHDGPPSSHPTAKSQQLFRQLCGTLLRVASEQPDPDLAINNLEQFVASTPARESLFRLWLDNEAMLRVVLSLFGNSVFLSKRLIQQPDLLDTLLNPASLTRSKTKEQLREELTALLAKADRYNERLDIVRRFKRAEEFRIGLQEIAGEVDILATMRELSSLADVYVEAVFRLIWEEWAGAFGLPTTPGREGFVIIALGKLGSMELDFASDLDLIFVNDDLGDEGAVPLQFAYNKIAEKLVQAIGGMSRYGTVFRIDLGLRPEGHKGPLVISLSGLQEYYQHRGQLWERQALLRARPVAGDANLAQRLMRELQSFAYETPITPDVVQKVTAMRRRIEQERTEEGKGRWDIKVGIGGLTDIEFLAQVFQLLYGATVTSLRRVSTWEVLEVIEREGFLPAGDVEVLRQAYRFLRRVESALRIVDDRSINTIPEDSADQRRLARRLGYRDEGKSRAEEAFLLAVHSHTAAVRELYERVMQDLGGRPQAENPSM
ncbi:MAG TPA: bifunctional [glutamate--ammonia ligase]-adenylyl-L-tyrosine phosphorylase/[glutamate--ammonia-ligase] adenylyltransferase [Alphaproteobacteria bacterium]|nr:bifunctional [glutamate--ammonia ligase]-adenylyl-L-tyrosine phosphorylase/[glutamate--ammonia-ligase] adenylyltransferase [Alphaproteobacteria bacterium]